MRDGAPAGILSAGSFDGRGGVREMAASDLASASDDTLWVHLDFDQPAAAGWLQRESGIDTTIVDALLAEESRPHFLSADDGMLIVLRGVNSNPGADPEDMVSIRLWIEPRRIVSTRRRRLLSVVDLRDALESGKGPRSGGEFVVQLIERLSDRIGDFVDSIEERLAHAEEALGEADTVGISSSVGELRRQIASVRRFLAPQRDALDRMYRQSGGRSGDRSAGLFSATEAERLREEADRFTRYLEDLDLARERAMVLREEYQSLLALQQNSRMYVLSIVAGIFLPLGLLTGLLGINVGGVPGANTPWAFAAVCFLLVAFGVGEIWILRRLRWF